MFSCKTRALPVCCFALSVFLATTCGIQAWAEQPAESATPTIEQLIDACRSAKEAFVPRTEAHLEEARKELLAAVGRLDRKLKASGAHGEGWRKYLDWSGMQEQLAREDGPDLNALDAVYAKYVSGEYGLDLVAFADVRRGLRRYLITARAIGNDQLQNQYQGLLDALVERLQSYQNEPDTESAVAIGQAVTRLEETGQAPGLVAALRGHFADANLFLQISADFVAAGMAAPVKRKGPFEDVILGTQITGTEQTTGEVTVELIPRNAFAEISMVFRGTIETDNVGRNGPARVTSTGVTKVAARKALRLDAKRIAEQGHPFWPLPAKSNAVTTSTIKSVQAGGGGMVAQQARQQVYASKAQADRIGADHSKQRTNQRMDQQVREQIRQPAEDFDKKLRKPLMDRDLFPQQLDFHSTESAVHMTALHGGLPGLGTVGPPPPLNGNHDMAARLHESLVNNFASAAYSGVIVVEERLRADLTELLGSTPPWLEPDEDDPPWTITLAQRNPVSVTFADGGFSVTMRGRKYVRGGSSYPGMNVTADYKIETSGDQPKAIRQGGLKIYPPGFKPGSGEKLDVRQQVLRTLLEKRFDNIFAEEIIPEPMVLSGAWEKAGQLVLSGWESSNGWMTMTWKRAPKPEEPVDAGQTEPAAK